MIPGYLDKLFGLKGKVALVTGGRQGIGQVIARELARAGADIAVFNRHEASETVDIITKEGGKCISVTGDVTNPDDVQACVDKVVETYGHIDILVNDAGVCYHKSAIEETNNEIEPVAATLDDWKKVININLTGTYIVSCAVAKAMIAKGTKGSIVNIASLSAHIVNVPQRQAAYNASKAGVIQMTKSLAIEWVDKNIRVNSISPGYIATPMSIDPNFVDPRMMEAWKPLWPMHRMAPPEELCGAIIWLCGENSAFTTGEDIVIDGGYSLV